MVSYSNSCNVYNRINSTFLSLKRVALCLCGESLWQGAERGAVVCMRTSGGIKTCVKALQDMCKSRKTVVR